MGFACCSCDNTPKETNLMMPQTVVESAVVRRQVSKWDVIKIQALIRGFLARQAFKQNLSQCESKSILTPNSKFSQGTRLNFSGAIQESTAVASPLAISDEERSQVEMSAPRQILPESGAVEVSLDQQVLRVERLRQILPEFQYGLTTSEEEEGGSVTKFKRKEVIMEDGSRYTGEWNYNTSLRHGRGKQIWPDGSIYDGYWKSGFANGRGRLVHADGDVYEGSWKDDKTHGKGKYHHANGATYDGDWVHNKQHGEGTESQLDGSSYAGQFKHGMKDGKGRFKWSDGSTYSGAFLANDLHGIGTYQWPDGRIYTGDWIKNKMHGKGFFTWLDGRKFEGQFMLDKKHGHGIYSLGDGREYDGYWKLGSLEGPCIYRNEKGGTRFGMWKGGKRTKWIELDEFNQET